MSEGGTVTLDLERILHDATGCSKFMIFREPAFRSIEFVVYFTDKNAQKRRVDFAVTDTDLLTTDPEKHLLLKTVEEINKELKRHG